MRCERHELWQSFLEFFGLYFFVVINSSVFFVTVRFYFLYSVMGEYYIFHCDTLFSEMIFFLLSLGFKDFNIFLHIYTHFNALKNKALGKHSGKKVKLLKMSNFTFFHNVFYATCILRLFNHFPNKPLFLRVRRIGLLKTPREKGEIARDEQFLLFPQCFLPFRKTFQHFHQI